MGTLCSVWPGGLHDRWRVVAKRGRSQQARRAGKASAGSMRRDPKAGVRLRVGRLQILTSVKGFPLESAAGNASGQEATRAWRGLPGFGVRWCFSEVHGREGASSERQALGPRGHSGPASPRTCLPLPGQAELPRDPLPGQNAARPPPAQAAGQKPHPHTLPCHEVSKSRGSKMHYGDNPVPV